MKDVVYVITHPSYIKAWGSKLLSHAQIKELLSFEEKEAEKTISILLQTGAIVEKKQEQEKSKK
jgi:hypothetical protein